VYPIGSAVNQRGPLELGGCDAVELAREFGTPVYIVVEDDLRLRARAFLQGLRARHPNSDVLFASKAFPCTAVYRLLAAEGLGCDVASGGELALALRGGFDPARIYLHGNAKSERELREALRAGVGHVVLDSFDDLDKLERVAAELGVAAQVLVRVTPEVSGDTHASISTGQADSKFGFGLREVPDVVERLATHPRLRHSRNWASSTCTTSAVDSGSHTPQRRSRLRYPTTSRRSSTRRTPSSAPASGC
jgi:diaminopimelate decarboxylase